MEKVLETEGCGALRRLHERSVYEAMLAEGKLGVAFEDVTVDPQKGIIIINQGEIYCLEDDPGNDVEKIKNFGMTLANAS